MTAFTVVLPYPPSANRIWRVVKRRKKPVIKSEAYRAWQEAAGWYIRAAGIQRTMTEDVAVTIELVKCNRRSDCDNAVKPILDILQHCHVIGNDNQVKHHTVIDRTDEKDIDFKGARVTVTPFANGAH